MGPLIVEREGQPIALPSGRQRSLLALLLLAGGVPLSRDRLIDELWGERPPASAVSALHVHLSKLRVLLEGLLVLEPAGYALHPGAFDVDAWRFDALVDRAGAEPDEAARLLTTALAMFRGDPLCDVAAEGSIASWRRTLEEKRLRAHVLRIESQLAEGGAGELVAELERLVDEHPLEEQLWGQLMLALYRAGRQAEALEAYQRIRRLLSSELGLDPGEPLARLQQQILDRDPALVPVAAPPAPSDVPAPSGRGSSNIPLPPTRLVGRNDELEALAGLMADPEVRLVTLVGPGGVGKTRLMLEVGRHQEPNFRDGGVLVRLERVTDPALVAAEIASALAQRDANDGPSPDGLLRYLQERDVLLVIDNFEHLLEASLLIAELLAGAPRLRVVLSSRTALRIRGEQVFEVEPLALPSADTAEEISRSPAVQLFLQSALAANRQFPVDDASTRTVAGLCRALDGLPLAVELAAARARSMTIDQIADQLAEPLLIGGRSLRDLPARQQTLEATISWSYELLPEEARGLLCTAAVFLGGFTRPALEAVADRPVDIALDELLDASLVRRHGGSGRFELLQLVRAFALDKLGDGAAEVQARHRLYFAEHVAEASERFDAGHAPGELAEPLLPDHANVRAALENALDEGDDASGVRLALGLRPVWLAGMLRQESDELTRRLLDESTMTPTAEISLLRAVSFLEGFGASPRNWNGLMAARAAELGDQETQATATGNLFARALNARDVEEMARLRPMLLAVVTPEASPKALGWTHYFLALDSYVNGHLDEACEHAALSAEMAVSIGHEYMLGSAAGTLLLAQSAREGVIRQPELAETVELMARPSIAPLTIFALWLVARYAAGVAPQEADRWLAQAELIARATDTQLWPESEVRDETMAVLNLDDLAPLLEREPPRDHVVVLAEAGDWVAHRDPLEQAIRERASAVA